MKTITKLVLLALLATVWMGCSKDNEEEPVPPVDLVLSVEDGVIWVNELDYEFEILEGNGGYTVESSDEKMAKTRVEGEKVLVYFLGNGSVNITVSDREGKSKKAHFIFYHESLTLSNYYLFLDYSKTAIVDLDFGVGGGYYLDGVDPDIIDARIEGDKMIVKSVMPGTDSLTIFDRRGSRMAMKVIVSERFDLTDSRLEIETGRNRTFHIKLLWGEDDYTVSSDSPLFTRVVYHKQGHADGTSTIQVDTGPDIYGLGDIVIRDKHGDFARVAVNVKYPK